MERARVTMERHGIAPALVSQPCRSVAALIPVIFMMFLAACATDSPSSVRSAGAPGSTTLNIGGAEIKFEPVDGWCLTSEEQSRRVLEDAPKNIKAYAVMADCQQLHAGSADDLPASFGFIATPTKLINTDVGDDRAAFVDTVVERSGDLDLAKAAKEAQASKRDQIQSEIDAAKREGVEIHIGDPIDLGLLAHDDSAACFGVLQKFAVRSAAYSDSISFVTLFCATEIRGRAIILTMQTRTGPASVTNRNLIVATALGLARSQIEQLIESNPDLGLAI